VNDVIDQSTARTMKGLLRAVTQHGTGAAAAQLNHPFGGKTGTTSDYTDAWFLGFSPSITCGVWVGYDSNQSLGEKETGAKAALPIWINVMRVAIAGKDDERFLGDQPSNPMLQASAAKPATPPAPGSVAKQSPPSASTPPAKSAKASVKPPVTPASTPAAKSPAPPAAKPQQKQPMLPGASSSTAKLQVKQALPPQPPPPRPNSAVKPALDTN